MADRIFRDDDTVTEKDVLLEIYRVLRFVKFAVQIWLALTALALVISVVLAMVD